MILNKDYIALVTTGVGIVGTLSGVVLGQAMSRSWQREQWVLDRIVEEFRELLDALAEGFRASMTMYAGAAIDEQGQREIVQAHSEAMRVIRSRIFTIREVIDLNVEVRWSVAVNEHRKTLQVEPFAATFNALRVALVNAAHASVKISSKRWYKRLWPFR